MPETLKKFLPAKISSKDKFESKIFSVSAKILPEVLLILLSLLLVLPAAADTAAVSAAEPGMEIEIEQGEHFLTYQDEAPEAGQEEVYRPDQEEIPQTDQEGIPGPVEEDYFRGEVLEVESYTTQRGLNQTAEVKITSGPYAGNVVTIDNYYEEHNRFLDIILEEGMQVILVGFEQGGEMEFHLQDMARDRGLLWAGLLLGAALLIVGKIK